MKLLMALLLLPQFAFAQNRKKPLYYGNNYNYPKSQDIEIDGPLLGQCFALVANSYKEIRLSAKDTYPSLFSYLIGTEAVDYKTGKEAQLKEKILAAKDNSIDPLKLFSWSLELHKGDLFKSILAIHELLRNEARFYRQLSHNYPSDKKSMAKFFNKFIDIRGDLEERGDNFTGDHRGSWYRIWGTMLDHLNTLSDEADAVGSASHICKRSRFRRGTADFQGSVIAPLAENIKRITVWKDVDDRKAEINQAGYDVISEFFDVYNGGTIVKDLKKKCENREYLKTLSK